MRLTVRAFARSAIRRSVVIFRAELIYGQPCGRPQVVTMFLIVALARGPALVSELNGFHHDAVDGYCVAVCCCTRSMQVL